MNNSTSTFYTLFIGDFRHFDNELTQRFIESVRIDEEIRKIKGLPASGYDVDLKKAYLLRLSH